MIAPSASALKAASLALADGDSVDLALAIKVAALIDAERAACEQAVRDSGVKVVGKFACAFETLRGAVQAIRGRGKPVSGPDVGGSGAMPIG